MLSKTIYKIGFVLFIAIFVHVVAAFAAGEEQVPVGYGGVYTTGSESNYPVYQRNKKSLNKEINNVLEKINAEESFPFEIIFETDTEARKKDIDYPYSLAVLITRDDVSHEKFVTDIAMIHKTAVNAGVVIILYQTTEDSGKKRNTIIFSIPLVGYSLNLEGKNPLSEEQLDSLFVKTVISTIREHLSKRLRNVSLRKINGEVTNINGDKAIVNIGAVNGITENQKISFMRGAKRIASGTVIRLKRDESIVMPDDPGFKPEDGMKIYGYNIKGVSDETYQVVGFKVSSKKAAIMFNEKMIGPQISQWLSDFISDRTGKVVLPSKIGSGWSESATERSFMKLMKDGKEHIFESPSPKYPIIISLTGLSSKVMEENKINQVWAYKSWITIEMPSKKYSNEFSDTVAKSVVPGIQSFTEKDELYDLLHQLTAKIAKEMPL